MDSYNANESVKAQRNLCDKKGLPHFAPNSGLCWKCNKNIYEPIGWKIENGRKIQVPLNSDEQTCITGITVEKAGKNLVTGCPHCNRSYSD